MSETMDALFSFLFWAFTAVGATSKTATSVLYVLYPAHILLLFGMLAFALGCRVMVRPLLGGKLNICAFFCNGCIFTVNVGWCCFSITSNTDSWSHKKTSASILSALRIPVLVLLICALWLQGFSINLSNKQWFYN